MAVIVQYVVVRDGDEKMTFATKKEADAYDKMLDIADNLYDFFEEKSLSLTEEQMESVSMTLAEHADTVVKIMKGVKRSKAAVASKPSADKKSATSSSSKSKKTAPKKVTKQFESDEAPSDAIANEEIDPKDDAPVSRRGKKSSGTKSPA